MERLLWRELVVGTLLAMWFLLSVWAQLRGAAPFRLLRVDLSWYVTRYSFFAPDPHFVRGLLRLRPSTDHKTSAGEPVWRFAPRTVAGIFWNPRRLPDYTFRRSCLRSIRFCELAEGAESLENSRPFRRIMNVARYAADRSNLCGDIECELREVTATRGDLDAEERIVHSTVLRGPEP